MTRREANKLILTIIFCFPVLILVSICQVPWRETQLLIRTLRSYWAQAQPFLLPWTTYVQRRREVQNKARNPFLKLPAELRIRIYQLAMPANLIIDRSGCMQYTLEQLQDGSSVASYEDTHHSLECDRKQGCLTVYPGDIHRLPIGPKKWKGCANMTQVCRALRIETLAFFHGQNSFAFSRQPWSRGSTAPKHSWKWNYDVDRMSVMRVEHWLKTRPSESLPFLTVMLMSQADCPARHHNQIRRAHDIELEATRDLRSFSWEPRPKFRISGDYLIMLNFANSRELKLVTSARSDRGHMVLHDCRWCLERVDRMWKDFTARDEWRSARDSWHDKLDAGTLSWKDALRMIDLIRDHD